jgi:integrase
MPTLVLTDIVARAAKPIAGRQVTLWDASLPSFGLRVGARAKTWTVMLGKERRRVTLGRYPAMGLQAARSEARRLILAAAVVRNQPGLTPITFSSALEKFVEVRRGQIRERTHKEYERVLRKHFEPEWKSRLLTEITRADVNRVLDGLLVDTPIMANNAFRTIRVFLRWAIRRGYVAHSPCEALQPPAKQVARERVLEEAELQKVLAAASEGGAFGSIVILLLLTAQRRSEIGGLRSEWIDRRALLIRFPKEITKNGRGQDLPLTPLALRFLPDREGHLFPAEGAPGSAFNGWSASMDAFRRRCGVESFTLHDLRRTAATMMAELGTPPHILERILNHVTGTTAQSITPLGRIYNRHRYLSEMREALCRWEQRVLELMWPWSGPMG